MRPTPTEIRAAREVVPKGGKRPGAGRPPATNPASKMITVKVTPEQYKRWKDWGSSHWLKRMLSLPQKPEI